MKLALRSVVALLAIECIAYLQLQLMGSDVAFPMLVVLAVTFVSGLWLFAFKHLRSKSGRT